MKKQLPEVQLNCELKTSDNASYSVQNPVTVSAPEQDENTSDNASYCHTKLDNASYSNTTLDNVSRKI